MFSEEVQSTVSHHSPFQVKRCPLWPFRLWRSLPVAFAQLLTRRNWSDSRLYLRRPQSLVTIELLLDADPFCCCWTLDSFRLASFLFIVFCGTPRHLLSPRRTFRICGCHGVHWLRFRLWRHANARVTSLSARLSGDFPGSSSINPFKRLQTCDNLGCISTIFLVLCSPKGLHQTAWPKERFNGFCTIGDVLISILQLFLFAWFHVAVVCVASTITKYKQITTYQKMRTSIAQLLRFTFPIKDTHCFDWKRIELS